MDFSKLIPGLLDYFEKGGAVMWPLAVATFVLWYTLGYRYMVLRRGASQTVSQLVRQYAQGNGPAPRGLVDAAALLCVRAMRSAKGNLRPLLDDACALLGKELESGRVLIKSIVVAAPLTGLLGTVTGMIETFDSLADMSLYSQSGGIAGGISQALFTTQMGLVVAVPGILIGRALDRRQAVLEAEIARVKDTVCTSPVPPQTA
jgi:biopolymer transport protein ExbB